MAHKSCNVLFEVLGIIKIKNKNKIIEKEILHTRIHTYIYMYTHLIDLWKIPMASTCTCVTAVFRNYFNFPLVVFLRAARKSRGVSRQKRCHSCTCLVHVYEYVRTYVRVCVRNARDTRHSLWPHSSFTRYLAFPFLSYALFLFLVLPRYSSQVRRAHIRCVHVREYVFWAKAMYSTCRGSLPMHANPVSKLSKCTRKCITDEDGGRMKGQGKGVRRDDKLWIESWNCYGTA